MVDAAETVKAVAVRAGYDDSAVGSAAYTRAATANLTGLALSGSPAGYSFAAGTYTYSGVTVANAVASVTVTPTGSGTITVEGSTVTSGGASDPIALTVDTPKTITVVTTETGKSARTYTIEVTRKAVQPTPTFSPAAGPVAWPTDVTITSADADAIYYTTNGDAPTRSSTLYAGPVTVSGAQTLKALAVKAGRDDSAVGSAAYTQAASADLTGLILSDSPAGYSFAAGTYTYSGVTVANSVASVTVTPTGSGTITVDGTTVASGSASGAIALSVGTPKTITVVTTETGKSAKTYTIEVTRKALAVGDAYQGGIIAYILQSGDPGYVPGVTSGLIAATVDQSSGIVWALPAHQAHAVPGGTGTALGTGSANTDKIIGQNGAGTGYAAGLARAYTGGDYSDWYLPSQDELDKVYANRTAIGGFDATGYYWSSSEYSADYAWDQYFGGGHYTPVKYTPYRVRAVRSFSIDPAKAITAFSFASPAATGVITESAHTIAVSVPFGTDVSALVASFTTTGASVKVGATHQVSGTTANDFTSPVTYRVTAGDGSTQDYVATVTVAPPEIGDAYQGGKVAYILQEGDPGYVAGETNGLIAATADQSATTVWALPGFTSTLVPGGTGTAIGTGSANTDEIISQNGAGTGYAAGLARAYAGGGFTDWYLPSLDELYKLYTNRVAIGGFTSYDVALYHSSSEGNASRAWVQSFRDGHQGWVFKNELTNVRAVRSFSGISSKAITAFSFQGLSPAATGVITEPAHTIAVSVPFGTDVSALVATFTTTGASARVGGTAQSRGVTANDFTSPVTYRVTAGDGSTQDYVVTVTVAPLAIGDAYQGGKVAYILQDGDPGYVAGQTKGLIAAAADQSTGIVWALPGFTGTLVPGGTGAAIGTGSANTASISSQNGAGITYAAGLADAYTNAETGTGVYSDWYLPSTSELNKLFINRAAIGGFESAGYWSSSEFSAGYAWFQAFAGAGARSNYPKSGTVHVRVARSFSVDPAAKAITAFSFEGLAPAAPGVINEGGHAISVAVPHGTDISALAATFATTGASVKVGGTAQMSGSTANDFTSPVTYRVTAGDGSTQDYVVTVTVAPVLAAGDSAFGGRVAYVLVSGDPGYSPSVQHGLIEAVADQGTAAWSTVTDVLVPVPAQALGTGRANTAAIVAQSGCTGGAAYICDQLVEGGYSDWYLPSKDELNTLYLSRDASFVVGHYRSSSEAADGMYPQGNAWVQAFDAGGLQGEDGKSTPRPFRAVHSF